MGVCFSPSGGTSVQEHEGETGATPANAAAPDMEYIRGSDWGGGVGGILYTSRAGVLSWAHYNGRGDVVTRTSDAGSLTYAASYEAFGTRTQEAGTNPDRQRANTKEEDPTGLLNEGFRYRDLELGMFISRDPAGFVDGPNVYTYVVQNPWSSFDPEGLDAKPSEEVYRNRIKDAQEKVNKEVQARDSTDKKMRATFADLPQEEKVKQSKKTQMEYETAMATHDLTIETLRNELDNHVSQYFNDYGGEPVSGLSLELNPHGLDGKGNPNPDYRLGEGIKSRSRIYTVHGHSDENNIGDDRNSGERVILTGQMLGEMIKNDEKFKNGNYIGIAIYGCDCGAKNPTGLISDVARVTGKPTIGPNMHLWPSLGGTEYGAFIAPARPWTVPLRPDITRAKEGKWRAAGPNAAQ